MLSFILTDFFGANKISLLKWLGNRPNLEPIENFCNVLKNKVAEKLLPNIFVLIKAIKLVWNRKISEEFCKNLIGSMRRRIKAVIKPKGRFTKYKVDILMQNTI